MLVHRFKRILGEPFTDEYDGEIRYVSWPEKDLPQVEEPDEKYPVFAEDGILNVLPPLSREDYESGLKKSGKILEPWILNELHFQQLFLYNDVIGRKNYHRKCDGGEVYMDRGEMVCKRCGILTSLNYR